MDTRRRVRWYEQVMAGRLVEMQLIGSRDNTRNAEAEDELMPRFHDSRMHELKVHELKDLARVSSSLSVGFCGLLSGARSWTAK
jgi:hypothetical protein